jgi:hypothetical protein
VGLSRGEEKKRKKAKKEFDKKQVGAYDSVLVGETKKTSS